MIKTSYLQQATTPRQYDSKAINWEAEGDGEDSIRRMLKEAALQHTAQFQPGSSHLDLGCGTGWLSAVYASRGLHSIGVDASQENITIANSLYINGTYHNADFIHEPIEGSYDLITAFMSFEHVEDIIAMMKKVAQHMNEGGRFVLVHGDYDYFTQNRFDVTVSVEETAVDGQVATKTEYGGDFGTLYDVIRQPELYSAAAQGGGLWVKDHLPLAVPEWLIVERPEYVIQRGLPMFQILIADKL